MGENDSPNVALSNRRQVLFVDDDAAFLTMVQELMSSFSDGHWEIFTATTPAEVFDRLKQHHIDLVVVDVRMGVIDGVQMLSMLNRGYPSVQKVALTGQKNEQHRNACLKNGAELYLEKPTNRHGWSALFTVLDELVRLRPEEGFQGVLRKVNLPDIIQMECLARSSSILEVSDRTTAGQIYIDNGQIVHALTGNAVGEAALNELLALSGGQFAVKLFAEPPQRSIEGQWEFLLMEAARKSDEAKESPSSRPEAEVPAPEFNFQLSMAPLVPVPAAPVQKPVASPPVKEDSKPQPTFLTPVPTVTPPPVGIPDRPRVDALLIATGEGRVLHEWQCPEAKSWTGFFEFAARHGKLMSLVHPLGKFERMEIHSAGVRAVIIANDKTGVLVKTHREPL